MFGLREKAGPYRHDLGAALLYDAGPGFRTMLDALITDPIDAAAVLDPIFFHHGRLRDAPAAAMQDDTLEQVVQSNEIGSICAAGRGRVQDRAIPAALSLAMQEKAFA